MGWLIRLLLYGLLIALGLWGLDGDWKLMLLIIISASVVSELIRLWFRRKGVVENADMYLEDAILRWWRKRNKKQGQISEH